MDIQLLPTCMNWILLAVIMRTDCFEFRLNKPPSAVGKQISEKAFGKEEYPDPRNKEGSLRCNRGGKPSWVCDPGSIITTEEADALDEVLNKWHSEAECECQSCRLHEGPFYKIMIALVPRLKINGRVLRDYREAEQAIEEFTDYQLKAWDRSCADNVAVSLSLHDSVLWTEVGRSAQAKLPIDCVRHLFKEHLHHFSESNFYLGFNATISSYVKSIKGELKSGPCKKKTPPSVWWRYLLIASFLAFCLIFIVEYTRRKLCSKTLKSGVVTPVAPPPTPRHGQPKGSTDAYYIHGHGHHHHHNYPQNDNLEISVKEQYHREYFVLPLRTSPYTSSSCSSWSSWSSSWSSYYTPSPYSSQISSRNEFLTERYLQNLAETLSHVQLIESSSAVRGIHIGLTETDASSNISSSQAGSETSQSPEQDKENQPSSYGQYLFVKEAVKQKRSGSKTKAHSGQSIDNMHTHGSFAFPVSSEPRKSVNTEGVSSRNESAQSNWQKNFSVDLPLLSSDRTRQSGGTSEATPSLRTDTDYTASERESKVLEKVADEN